MSKIAKMPNVSVIIPVYNEQKHIGSCLRALQNQSVNPLEIIVVNNNCTDKTVAIAKRYGGVKVIAEPIQGMIPARNRGFNAAKGEILARIDADTVVPSNWLKTVSHYFKTNADIDGLGGYGIAQATLLVPEFARTSISRLWSLSYFAHARAYFGVDILWGGNMAIRKSAWSKVKNLVITDSNIHEDIDLSLALAGVGAKVKILPGLLASVDFYEMQYFAKFWRYNQMKHRTKKMHIAHSRSRLPQIRRIVWYRRVVLYSLSIPMVWAYTGITGLNSGRRYVAKKLKRSAK